MAATLLSLDSAAGVARWEFFWPPGTGAWLPARVPGCIHLDLHREGLIPDPFHGDNERELQWIEREGWAYRAHFELPPESLARHEVIELVAEGLDTLAAVTLNGEPVGRSENMFTGVRWPVKGKLRAGANELRVHFASPMPYLAARRRRTDAPEWNDRVGGCAHLRKEQRQFGWDWGPRLVTCGVWRPLRLEAWSGARLETVRVRQEHSENGGSVTVRVTPRVRLAGGIGGKVPLLACRARLSLDGEPVAGAAGLDVLALAVPDARLWWPNGHGAQPLYGLEVELLDDEGGAVLDTWRGRVGLRTITLDRSPDADGEKFQFVVNGRPIFAKGANWIPAHAFAPAVSRADLDDLLASAADAHCNMLRVWGGGVYESEEFYDLCDEKGLLVWQDFMFACALYPGRPDFLRLVEDEANHQVQRLAHRACLALWCGNNEVEQRWLEILLSRRRTAAFENVFYRLLPAAVARHDGVTPYWPGSPHNPAGWRAGVNTRFQRGGDAHFWDVWHLRQPVEAFEKTRFRFVSEFGLQSFSSPEVAGTFCPPAEWRLRSPAMANHQKNAPGNALILHYLARLYRVPPDYPTLAYLSQLSQLHAMKIAVEHFRRAMPRTMGALYWQLNDCWPVFSWSSLEFGGKPKALHFGAKRFFAPALVSAHLPGGGQVHLFTVDDGQPSRVPARLAWELRHLADDSHRLERGEMPVTLRSGESVLQRRLDFSRALAGHGAANVFLHVALWVNDGLVSEDTVFLTAPRFLNLPRGPVEASILGEPGPGEFELEFRSPVFQHRVWFDFDPPLAHRASDNFFDLLPGRPHRVRLRLLGDPEQSADADALRARLRTKSLADCD